MRIEQFKNMIPDQFQSGKINKSTSGDFGNMLADFVGSVNQDQINANQLADDFVTGKGVEIHEVMIAGEKAKTSLELLMEIRNKTIDMYKELTKVSV